jgi:uncharacterized OB-fold protein
MAMAKDRKIPAPVPNVETQPYWDAAANGKLLIMACTACKQVHHYPRAHCPFCFSDQTEWRETKGEGIIYSYSVMRRAPQPYALAYVTLAEGPTMITNLVDCDFDQLKIGQKVKVVFKPTEGGPPVPCFKPA